MGWCLRYLLLSILVLGVIPLAHGQGTTIAEATSWIRTEFERLDRDFDRSLGQAEFLARDLEPAVLKRDFILYDGDRSGTLSLAEFAAVSGLVPPSLRGTMSDPFDDLVAAAVAALDESYDGWNQRPRELVNAHTFVANFLGSISPGSKLFVTGRILRQADQDSDGRLSRSEAKRFIEQQLGYRWYAGPPLREPTGRLVRFDWFLDVDSDQSGSLTREEFNRGWWNRANLESDFLENDRDGNGQISYAEYGHPDSKQYFDPIEWFRGADQNLDALLDAGEMFAASDDSRRQLVASSFHGFDTNGDERLTLDEYRLSLHANVNFSWQRKPVDKNRDGRLSYDEFQFHSFDLFHLQRRYFFHRLDRDADGFLSRQEFAFQSRRPDGVHLLPVGGGSSRLLFRDPEFPRCGWPVLSPDGSSVLFHRCRPDDATGQIVRFDVESGESSVLNDGLQPSWSRNGRRFVCTRETGERGIWIMSETGDIIERLGEGSSAKWSPDGQLIAFLHDNGLWVHHVAIGHRRCLLERDQHDYQNLGDDIAWSPDSGRIAFVGRTTARSDLILLKVDDSTWSTRFQFPPNQQVVGHLSWSHQRGVVFQLHDQLRDAKELLTLGPADQADPMPAKWLSSDRLWKSACVSPSGIWYTAISED